ncbi:MAG: hypothetical protein WDM85_12905 [Caulobacteraceae bacterium]
MKLKIPLFFEAEGEGLAPILCAAALCALIILLTFLAFCLAPNAVVHAILARG